jgi:BirA family transcriptional regulator, biotin operon repressor / biotin---[acetyl-CoA-carboxylase] ligase
MTSGAKRITTSESKKLAPRSSFLVPDFIRHVEIHDELPSTSDRAIQLTLFEALETPALIVAHRQFAGRGRGTHAWWSADGALMFSLILEPAAHGIAVNDWPKLSLTTAVAVCDAAQMEVPDTAVQIKWPNDVLVDGRKVAGILLESPGGAAPAKNRLVIGVGINVNNSWRDAPNEAGTRGTALCDVTRRQHDPQAILVAFLNGFDKRLHQFGHADVELPRAWQKLSWLTGKQIEVEVAGQTLSGNCLGIADDGALLLQTPHAVEQVYSGSVRAIAQSGT